MSILDKSSLVMLPSGYKEDKLYSVKPRNGDGDFTFTRASTGTRVNSDGYIEEVAWNKLTYSEDFTNANYIKNNCTVTANQSQSPIGTTTADQIDFGSGSGYFYSNQSSITTLCTYSIYVKYIDYQFIQIIGTGDVDHYANFDIQNGIVGNTGSQSTASIEDAGNGWYRCIINYNDGTFSGVARIYKTTSLTASWAGGGGVAGSFYFWGNQFVNGGLAKKYIKTTDRLDIPRLDYSGGATSPTLLLEPQRTNTIVQSEDLSIGTILNNATVTTDQTTSPSNIDNADKVTFGSGSGFFYKQTAISSASTYSIFLKYEDYQYFQIMSTGDVDHYANFDILNGTVGNVGSQANASIEDYGNGWYRCILNMTAGTFAGSQRIYKVSSLTSNWAGGGGDAGSVFAWGVQLESGIYVTSYIPTMSTSVTRNAEACYILNNTDVIGQEEGVVFIDLVFTGIIETYSIFKLSQNASNLNRLQLYFQDTRLIVLSASTSGATIVQIIENPTTIGKRYKVAIQYKDLDFKVYLNGTQVYTNTTAYSPNGMNQVTFSSGGTSTQFGFYNDIKQVSLFKEILTDTELETLTTI